MIFEDKGYLGNFSNIGSLIKHLQYLNLLSDSIVVVTSLDNECMYCMFGYRDLKLLLEHYKQSSYSSCHHYSVYSYREYPVDFFQILLFDDLQSAAPTVFL